ncbi:MAG: hypothetical protein KGI27_07900 [Thaumarchaeota archaeon]|nr:hypothetical protein [Nitrososphaerota archaeon]
MAVVVSSKIPEELRKKARTHNLKISKIVRKAIEDEVRRIEEESLSKNLDRIGRVLRKNVSSNDIVKAVRSSRDEK